MFFNVTITHGELCSVSFEIDTDIRRLSWMQFCVTYLFYVKYHDANIKPIYDIFFIRFPTLDELG